jgi:hypothetical protein
MRVLLSNHHLAVRAGSELYVAELATALKAGGHDARVFTFIPGELSHTIQASGVPVYTTEQAPEVVAFQPDIVHAHHGPTLWWLGAHLEGAPVIFSSLGVLPPHEAPPAAWPGVAHGVAVSEEVLGRLTESPFGRAVPLSVMRNWFDDRGWTPVPAVSPARVRRVAVVTNHLAPGIATALKAFAAAGRLEWTHYGLPSNSIEVVPALLEPFDLVITIGRTALLAAALGKPCLLWDVHGCDGFLEAERLPALASVNFSGRLTCSQPTTEEFEALLERATTLDTRSVQQAMVEGYRLTDRARQWVDLYRQVIDGEVRLDAESRTLYRPVAELYTDALIGGIAAETRCQVIARDAEHLRTRLAEESARAADALAQVARLGAELEGERARVADALGQVVRLLSELKAERARAAGERDALQSRLTDASERAAALAADLEAHRALVSAPGARDALRMASAANRLRLKLLPEGTRRFGALRTTIHWARGLIGS